MSKNRWPKRIALAVLALLVVAAAGLLIWAYTPPAPLPEALAALASDGQVQVDAGRWLTFRPIGAQPDTGLVFYPGGRVDPRSYAPAAHAMAAQGYLVVIVPMPLNLAVLAADRAAEVMAADPGIWHWAVGGHSLGGAMAAQFAYRRPGEVQGLVLWAAYPPQGDDLSARPLQVLSAYGTRDGLALKGIEAARLMLPAATHWLPIEGGNHAQFGWYGRQAGDNDATITREAQQAQTVDATVALLAAIGKRTLGAPGLLIARTGSKVRKQLRFGLAGLACLSLAALVGPLIWPIKPLAGTLPPEQLAGPESRFLDVGGARLHYRVAGPPGGKGPAFILLHGFASSLYSWREVIGPLSRLAGGATVIAYDRPGFGLTSRPLPGQWTGTSPYSWQAQPELLIGLMDALGIGSAILVGNSAGGAVAAATALRYPARVDALVLVDAAVYDGHDVGWARPLLATPQAGRLGPLFMRSFQTSGRDFARLAWHDPSRITPEIWAGYNQPLQAQDWDQALWQVFLSAGSPGLSGRLASIQKPALVITGDDDRIVRPELSRRLAGDLPNATLAVISECGHVPHEERPEAFMAAVEAFVATSAWPSG